MKSVEIVVPCYNEQDCIEQLYIEVEKVFADMAQYTFSILFVNDGSRDDTLYEIQRVAEKYGSDKVKYISFARNFGKESAIYAGFENCSGDYIVLMDADLQHPPTLLPKMLEKLEEGYDCCGARRISRKGEPVIRSFFSKAFYRIINRVTQMNLVPGGSDYRAMTRQMVNAIVSMTERERFIKGIMSWVGFDTVWIPYENVERFAGTSKWSFWGLVRYAWSGFVAFATTPLRAVIYLGIVIITVDAIYGLMLFFGALFSSSEHTGYNTIVLLLMFFGGVIIMLLGLIGEYIARIYLELKHRPIYITKETNISEKKADGE